MKVKNKLSIGKLLLSIAYVFLCCLVFFSLSSIAVGIIINHRIEISYKDIKYIVVASAIAGVAAGLRSWIFAKIDECKNKRPHQ